MDICLVLAGGAGLGAYQAGACETLHSADRLQLRRIAASSVGAVNAALIAGNETEHRLEALRKFWWNAAPAWPDASRGPLGHMQNWTSVLQARLFGAAGYFRPRQWTPFGPFKSLYDLAPMRRRLEGLVDFGRLNSGDVRIVIATTDIETGELVLFDTARDRITIEHVMASCGLLPDFAPVEIDGRLLGDGALSANAPIEGVLDGAGATPLTFVIDLFARDGARPQSLEDAVARKNDLVFANQTLQRLAILAESGRLGPTLYLSYRAVPEEAGADKMFDLGSATLAQRWMAGTRDMERALRIATSGDALPPLTFVRRAAA